MLELLHVHAVVEILYTPSQAKPQQPVSESVSLVHDVEMQEPPEHIFPVSHTLPSHVESTAALELHFVLPVHLPLEQVLL
jgi:hypothetical protein